jgi:hypothetical protein
VSFHHDRQVAAFTGHKQVGPASPQAFNVISNPRANNDANTSSHRHSRRCHPSVVIMAGNGLDVVTTGSQLRNDLCSMLLSRVSPLHHHITWSLGQQTNSLGIESDGTTLCCSAVEQQWTIPVWWPNHLANASGQ